MTFIQWEPGDDPSYFLSFTPRRTDDRTLPVDPALIDRAALALAGQPTVVGVLVTTEADGSQEVHAAFDLPHGQADRASRVARGILRPLGLETPVTVGSGPAGWGSVTTWIVGPVLVGTPPWEA